MMRARRISKITNDIRLIQAAYYPRPGPHWNPHPTRGFTLDDAIVNIGTLAKMMARHGDKFPRITKTTVDLLDDIAWAMEEDDKRKGKILLKTLIDHNKKVIAEHGNDIAYTQVSQGMVNLIDQWISGMLRNASRKSTLLVTVDNINTDDLATIVYILKHSRIKPPLVIRDVSTRRDKIRVSIEAPSDDDKYLNAAGKAVLDRLYSLESDHPETYHELTRDIRPTRDIRVDVL